MASYQSRGSFHSTEQLSFRGTGRFRELLNIHDPPWSPNTIETEIESVANASNHTQQPVQAGARVAYNGQEVDVSFCIVSNILVARLTRWQLIMEDIPPLDR